MFQELLCRSRSALSVVLALFASYVVAMTVVPLSCAKLIKGHQSHEPAAEAGKKAPGGWWSRFNAGFNDTLPLFFCGSQTRRSPLDKSFTTTSKLSPKQTEIRS
jgi:hypothetical protein